ncbi:MULTISPECIES: transporter substrate-binding domain-containing protein [Halomonas]|uniref:Amino acid ABC transporter substrate-binding protein (PAAT family) n=1 Tax=Halomonas ventosae TaxID=229007 RepID=A0A4R6HC42_9GAMM|nr:transporter substrate-binding domain-containing protein [Halomonas ventosae]TDO06010.1 amino acid ABC transporter substrate-binding protein (PAAT family) [Halomonas ventosae]
MKRQLKTAWLSASIALGLGLSGVASANNHVLTVVTDPSFVPFEMMDQETGEMVGFDMDIINEVAERAGFEYNLRTMDFNGIIPAVQTGNVDIAIAGITITDQRAEIVDFSDPYYDSGLRILVRANDDSVNDIEDLEDKKIGTKVGSTSYDFLDENLGDEADIVPYPGSSDMYMALLGGSVDAVFYDAPNVGYFAKTRGEGRVKVVGPLYEGQQYGIVFVKGSEWVDPVNEALAAMKEDGTYDEIHAKWFGSTSGE